MTDIDIVDELRGFASGSESARATLMRDAAAEIERLRGEAEWEYAPAFGLHAPTTDRYALDCAPSEVVRRRKAGPWIEVNDEGH